MKHIKLFEQFDEFDPFGEEKENFYVIHTGDILKCKKTYFLKNFKSIPRNDIEEFTSGKSYKVTRSNISVVHPYLNPMLGSIYMEGNQHLIYFDINKHKINPYIYDYFEDPNEKRESN